MRIKLKILLITATIAVTASILVAFTATRDYKKASVADQGFALVELFTSEGCSSCPPADQAVSKLAREYVGKPVYILAFHVDYWDRLGWKDAFSSSAYSQRQRQYEGWLHLQSVYTPQIVVNGRTEFVGSEQGTLENAVKSNLKKPASAALSISDLKIVGNQATFNFKVTSNIKNLSLCVALIQKQAQTKVQRGENAGRTLSHVQIVRNIESVALKGRKEGIETISLPKDFSAASWELIGLAQDAANGQVEAATKALFTTENTLANGVQRNSSR